MGSARATRGADRTLLRRHILLSIKPWEGASGEVLRIIGMLLSTDSTGCSKMMVNGRQHRAMEKTCQYNI
jgi:hypothetical protein